MQIYTGFIYEGPGLIREILESDVVNNHKDFVIAEDAQAWSNCIKQKYKTIIKLNTR